MKTTKKICGITAEVEIEPNAPKHYPIFNSLEELVQDMTKRDVIYKFANINGEKITVSLQKTDEANRNWYENEMRVKNKHFPQEDLPTNMYK